jgi:hypothetical protein
MFVIDDLMLAAFAEAAPEMFAAEAFGAEALGAEALGTALGAEALMGLGAEALGAGAVGGAEAALGAEAMAANAAAGGAGAGGAGINAAQVAAQQNAAMQLANPGITGIPEVMSPAQQAYQAASSASAAPGMAPGTTPLPAYNNAFPGVESFRVPGFDPAPLSQSLVDPALAAQPQNASFLNAPAVAPGQGPMQYQLSAPNASQGLRLGTGLESIAPSGPISSVLQPPSALEAGMDKAIKFAEKNPFTAMTGAYMGANALGLLNPSGNTFNDKPYDGPLSRYRLSPNFQGRTANPLDFQYNPRGYAAGGIMDANAYDIPVGYAEGALVAPPRAAYNSMAFQNPNGPYSEAQQNAADAYGDIVKARLYNDRESGRSQSEPFTRGMGNTSTGPLSNTYYSASSDALTNVANRPFSTDANTPADSNILRARNELGLRSNEGEYAVPGYGDLGQFAGSFDPANVPMGNNRLSPADQYKAIAYDTAIMDGTAPIMPRDKSATIANLGGDSDVGRFAAPGYGDLGQFAGSSNPLKDDNPYNVDAFAKGGSLSESISEYQKMLSGQQQAAPAASRDVGIYYDQDPDTRYQDALTAAQIRQAKVNQRAYVSPPVAKRPTPLGKLNMPTSAKSKESSSGDVEAYRGGIMHSSLGGYAAGGNPRLLKGPGDGMSDNIPATINGRQPARLADGEFVVPADVVSHLGNGSTDAGAKQLHGMMDKVRKARTGNPKQGKEIKPQKYMPR